MKYKLLPTFLSLFTILIFWQILALSIGYPAIFPTLPDLLKNTILLFESDSFYKILFATIVRGLVGFLFSFGIAVFLAIIATFSPFWKSFLHPIFVVIRSIPVISLVLVTLLWFSPDGLPIFIALLTMLPILYQNFLNGLESTDFRYVEMAKVFGKSRIQIFINIYLPAAKILIFSGISTAMGFGWRVIIIGEVLAQPNRGIGSSMKIAQTYINVSELIAWTLVAIGISYFFEYMIKYISHIQLRYKHIQHIKTIKRHNLLFVKLHDISKNFNDVKVIDNFSYLFTPLLVYCLKSPSGSGKTTLLRLICGLERPQNGSIYAPEKCTFAYSFQDVRLLPWLTVEENIRFGMKISKISKITKSIATSEIVDLAKKLGIYSHLSKYPHELSGGEQQRVGIIRALVSQFDILLLDEPLTGLDKELKTVILEVIENYIVKNQAIVIWATHEEFEFKQLKIKEIVQLI